MKKTKNNELGRLTVDEFKDAEKTPIIVVLDNVRSALNVGSAFRTSDAFRIEKVYLCGITAQPPHRDIQKTALGANEAVDWEHAPNTKELLESLKSHENVIIGIEQTDDKIFLQDFSLDKRKTYILVFGNEVKGIGEELLPILDHCIEIPQIGTKHSFNISVSIGIVLWDLFVKYHYK